MHIYSTGIICMYVHVYVCAYIIPLRKLSLYHWSITRLPEIISTDLDRVYE